MPTIPAPIQPASIQEQIGGNACWGCGPLNPQGLQIKSYWHAGEAICSFMPQPQHCAGPPHVVNGGILATIIDCHSVCTAMAALYDAEARAIGSAPLLWCATASLHVEYLRPTPMGVPLRLRARVAAIEGRRVTVECILSAGARECARGSVAAVRVPDGWLAAPLW